MIEQQIKEEQQIIDTLPEKTIDNRKKKQEYIEKKLAEVKDCEKKLLDEMKKRYLKLEQVSENESISALKEEEKKLTLFKKWNNYNTSYEKMHLDYYLYQLHCYYKDDLKSVNACL